jgi:hypothetical protein
MLISIHLSTYLKIVAHGWRKPFKNLIFNQTLTISHKIDNRFTFVFNENSAKNGREIFSYL